MSKTPEAADPRPLDEIKAEYNSVCGLVGEAHLNMKASEARRDQFTQKLVNLHNEFTSAQNKLNKEKKDDPPTEVAEPTYVAAPE